MGGGQAEIPAGITGVASVYACGVPTSYLLLEDGAVMRTGEVGGILNNVKQFDFSLASGLPATAIIDARLQTPDLRDFTSLSPVETPSDLDLSEVIDMAYSPGFHLLLMGDGTIRVIGDWASSWSYLSRLNNIAAIASPAFGQIYALRHDGSVWSSETQFEVGISESLGQIQDAELIRAPIHATLAVRHQSGEWSLFARPVLERATLDGEIGRKARRASDRRDRRPDHVDPHLCAHAARVSGEPPAAAGGGEKGTAREPVYALLVKCTHSVEGAQPAPRAVRAYEEKKMSSSYLEGSADRGDGSDSIFLIFFDFADSMTSLRQRKWRMTRQRKAISPEPSGR